MDTISFRQGAHGIEAVVVVKTAIYIAYFKSDDEVLSFAATNGLISSADAQALISGNARISGWSKAFTSVPENDLLKMGFRRVGH